MTPFEAVVAAKLIEQGYDVLASGWPDFCAVKKTGDVFEVRFLEVKGRGDTIKPNQRKLHAILQILGITVEVVQEDARHRMQYPPAEGFGITVVKKHLTGRPPIARQNAITFLRRVLQDGPKKFREILYKAADENVRRSTLCRTAKDMGVIMKFDGKTSIWALPEEKTL